MQSKQLFDIFIHFRVIQNWKLAYSWTFFSRFCRDDSPVIPCSAPPTTPSTPFWWIIGIIGSEGTYDWKSLPEGWIFQSLVTEEPMNRNHIYCPLITILDEFSIIHSCYLYYSVEINIISPIENSYSHLKKNLLVLFY